MPRYTEEELSRILGEHAAGTLRKFGGENWENYLTSNQGLGCCINQAAYNTPSPEYALKLNKKPAKWFDENYRMDMSPEELLQFAQFLSWPRLRPKSA